MNTVAHVPGYGSEKPEALLSKFPAYACVLPWQRATLERQKNAIEKSLVQENAPYIK